MIEFLNDQITLVELALSVATDPEIVDVYLSRLYELQGELHGLEMGYTDDDDVIATEKSKRHIDSTRTAKAKAESAARRARRHFSHLE